MEVWALVLLFGVLVEAIVQVVKGCVSDGATVPGWLWPVMSAAIGVALCVLSGVDAFKALGVHISIPGIGSAVTGLFVSRGSNFLHDLWKRINAQSEITIVGAVGIEDNQKQE